jgi:hypothetical protein
MHKKAGIAVVAAFLFVGAAMADDEPLDVTISVVQSPNDLPAAVTKTIELPPTASAIGGQNSSNGLSTANQARALGRTFGQDVATEAKARKGKP